MVHLLRDWLSDLGYRVECDTMVTSRNRTRPDLVARGYGLTLMTDVTIVSGCVETAAREKVAKYRAIAEGCSAKFVTGAFGTSGSVSPSFRSWLSTCLSATHRGEHLVTNPVLDILASCATAIHEGNAELFASATVFNMQDTSPGDDDDDDVLPPEEPTLRTPPPVSPL